MFTLNELIERWAPLPLWALSLGAMGMFLVAAIVWQYPLNSSPVKYTALVSALMLGTGLTLVAVNVIQLLLTEPDK